MASKVKDAAGSVERFFLPRLNSIDGELKAINTRVDSVEKGMDSLRNELKAEIRAVATSQAAKIDNVLLKLDQIDKKLDIDRKLTILKPR